MRRRQASGRRELRKRKNREGDRRGCRPRCILSTLWTISLVRRFLGNSVEDRSSRVEGLRSRTDRAESIRIEWPVSRRSATTASHGRVKALYKHRQPNLRKEFRVAARDRQLASRATLLCLFLFSSSCTHGASLFRAFCAPAPSVPPNPFCSLALPFVYSPPRSSRRPRRSASDQPSNPRRDSSIVLRSLRFLANVRLPLTTRGTHPR